MIYLDNAATSWPKPPQVLKAMVNVLEYAGGTPCRSWYRLSIKAARVMYDAREAIAHFFNVSDPTRVIFTSNGTHSINLVLKGMLKPGDHVVTSSMEHNAVMRPLRSLEKRGVILDVVPCASDGSLEVNDIASAVLPNTRLVVIIHASNVAGTILPIAKVASVAHSVGALLLVDAAQTVGVLPIDTKKLGIDFLAFTGHKGLQGPPGIGGLVIGDHVDTSQIEPLAQGGTGSQSELEEQPEHLPDKFESGTPNIVGVAGLHAGVKWIVDRGIETIRAQERELTRVLIDALCDISGIKVHGTRDPENTVAIVSFTAEGRHVSEIGLQLDKQYGILTRVGLHCAPAAHKTIGTFPEGTVRLAPGVFTTADDIKRAIQAIRKAVRS